MRALLALLLFVGTRATTWDIRFAIRTIWFSSAAYCDKGKAAKGLLLRAVMLGLQHEYCKSVVHLYYSHAQTTYTLYYTWQILIFRELGRVPPLAFKQQK